MPKISDLPTADAVSATDFIAIVARTGTSVTKKATAAVFANGLFALAKGIKSDVAAVPGSSAVNNIVFVTQQQYDSIDVPDSNTLYLVQANEI
jgi:hypothetical protein